MLQLVGYMHLNSHNVDGIVDFGIDKYSKIMLQYIMNLTADRVNELSKYDLVLFRSIDKTLTSSRRVLWKFTRNV